MSSFALPSTNSIGSSNPCDSLFAREKRSGIPPRFTPPSNISVEQGSLLLREKITALAEVITISKRVRADLEADLGLASPSLLRKITLLERETRELERLSSSYKELLGLAEKMTVLKQKTIDPDLLFDLPREFLLGVPKVEKKFCQFLTSLA